METKQLSTFKMAAETLNFTHTANSLNFAQSTVTAQIKALESELGTVLFERLGKRLVLTEAGRQFKGYADKMITLTEEAKLMTGELKEPTGTLVIGAQESQCTYRLPPILTAFKSQFPNVKLIFKPAYSDEKAKELLHKGELDIAFIMDVPKPGHSLIAESLIEEEMKLVAASEHSLARKQEITPDDLEHETLLLTDEGCSYRTILEESLKNHGVYPANKFEFVSIEAIKQCVLTGLGIAFLPNMVVNKEIQEGRISELKWNHPASSFFTQIAWHKDKLITIPLQSFIDLTRKTFKEGNFQ
ncbi:LysR family transcriptional regulator [Halobacillus hunanensis]|uniref:LysR family transcriptional regulator n=1 Tax=Halobacillus hunanensis TaxID=578214 RepID=UPI001116BD8A|nr:LysR family transcriptional regulator [Halobacillus hunanensis]